MTAIENYLAPQSLEEVSRIAADTGRVILAGGTDLLPRWSRGLLQRPEALVSLRNVEGLKGVARQNGEVRIGACTHVSEIAADPIIRDAAPVLAEAAGRIACPQVRSRATIGGNLCNASPAADTAVPLILLDAVLDLARAPLLSEQCSDDVPHCSQSSAAPPSLIMREVPITDFFRGPGATVLAPGEILTHIRFTPFSQTCGTGVSPVSHSRPEACVAGGAEAGVKPMSDCRRPRRGLKSEARSVAFAAWDKFGTRPAMEIAVASVGIALKIEDGTITHARIAYGSVAPVPLRGRQAEARLVGNPISEETIGKCLAAARQEIAPITDVRASAAYRREMVGVLLRRMLQRAGCDGRGSAES
ncbi:MAG: xanthine dehydrogenase family protein subunit M [Phycisphaerae bacterium]|nr:xanthine dehydrogenase family protein subunit M [Phycisphaerae bacterium]